MSASVARSYFAAQSVAGAVWWTAVLTSDDVRRWTLGDWSPEILIVPDIVLFVGGSAIAALTSARLVAAVVAGWTTAVTGALVGYSLVTREAGWGALSMTASAVATAAAAATLWWGRLPMRWFYAGPFQFRVAPVQSGGRHLARSLRQLVLFWTLFLVAAPVALAWTERRLRLRSPLLDGEGVAWLGVGIFVAASAVGMWSCVTMALIGHGTPLPAVTARRLVVAGPYRVVRNPMAVAGALQTVGVGLMLGSWLVIASAGIAAATWHVLIRPAEEDDLAARFGQEYVAYREAVRCWIPSRALPRSVPTAAPRARS